MNLCRFVMKEKIGRGGNNTIFSFSGIDPEYWILFSASAFDAGKSIQCFTRPFRNGQAMAFSFIPELFILLRSNGNVDAVRIFV